MSPSPAFVTSSSPRRGSDISNISSLSLSDVSSIPSLSLSPSPVPRTFLAAPPRHDGGASPMPTVIVVDDMGDVAEQLYRLRR